MSLADKTLAQLAKLRAGIGPTSTVQAAALAAVNGAPAVNGDGVDCSGAILAVVKVRQDAGAPVFTVWGRTEGTDDEFDTLNNLISKSGAAGKPWSETVFCGPLVELYVEIEDMGGAAAIDITIEPCNG